MNRLKYILLGAMLMGLLLALSGFAGLNKVIANEMKPLLVQIVNTIDNPVPVTVPGPVVVKEDVATKSDHISAEGLPVGEFSRVSIETINASLVVLTVRDGDHIKYSLFNQDGTFAGVPIDISGTGETKFFPFPQKVPVTDIVISCVSSPAGNCWGTITIIGD